MPYEKNSILFCKNQENYYLAKIIDVQNVSPNYLVHFFGWSIKYDCFIYENEILNKIPTFKFNLGDKVSVVVNKKTFRGKIIGLCVENDEPKYLVRFGQFKEEFSENQIENEK